MKEKTQELLVKCAIRCFGRKGFEATTFDAVAKEAGVSRPLVIHYFKKKESLFKACVLHVAKNAREFVEKRMIQVDPHPMDHLKAYFAANLEWMQIHQDDIRFLLAFGLRCTWDRELRGINQQFKQTGRDRLTRILQTGQRTGQFKLNLPAQAAATLMHDIFYARIIALVTEDTPDNSLDFQKMFDFFTLGLVGMAS